MLDLHPDQIRARARATARVMANLALKGVPALRAALHGARLGAGRALSPRMMERLGVQVIAAPKAVATLAPALARSAKTTRQLGLVWRRGGAMVRAGLHEVAVHADDGIALRITPRGGAVASVSPEAMRALARTTVRGTVLGIGRAAMSGAAAGAVIDGGIAGVQSVMAVRRGAMAPREALRRVGLYAARGAIAGGVGVAAAGMVSAGLTATGIAIVGAPVAVPIATMMAVGVMASRLFDRRFGTH